MIIIYAAACLALAYVAVICGRHLRTELRYIQQTGK